MGGRTRSGGVLDGAYQEWRGAGGSVPGVEGAYQEWKGTEGGMAGVQ